MATKIKEMDDWWASVGDYIFLVVDSTGDDFIFFVSAFFMTALFK